MRAVQWYGKEDIRVGIVDNPRILNPHDAIVQVSLTAICGSDLHLYGGFIPTMEKGDVLGHEFMGHVVEVGKGVRNLKVGDRVVVPFPIACGRCWFCESKYFSLCDNTNPNAAIAEKLYGYSPSGIFGYSHMLGGYAGGQAEYVRVPFADVGPVRVPETLSDEEVLFLSDIYPTGYMAAENCDIKGGETIAVWGCGPVGQFCIQSAYLLGAGRVIAIDRIPERLDMARHHSKAECINYEETDVYETLRELTGGRGPDACIDAVGLESHGIGVMGALDRAQQMLKLETDRPTALREMIRACRKGGVVSLAGMYGGHLNEFPMGAAFNKGLTFKMGQTHVQRYLNPLLETITTGRIKPAFVISHRLKLDEAPEAYRMFQKKEGGCTKVVMKP